MDITTIVGLIAGFTLIVMGILNGGQLSAFIDTPSLLITLGGTVAGTLINHPLQQMVGLVSVGMKAFFWTSLPSSELIEKIVGFAETARREGILALEQAGQEIDDAFMSTGIRLAVDGTEPELIQTILETELSFVEERHKAGANIFTYMGSAGPAFGMIGTLVGLVNMLQNLDDPSALGPGMATALITTFYGAVVANLIFIPISGKLKIRSAEELLQKRMIMEGIMSIQSGDNPRIVEQKLATFIAPSLRPAGEDEGE
ncbi:MAG: motility protein A [Gemmatimonadetes bacterium]|nr:motility protein A [Gemmatimonadota bacterium]|tara:strand:- start:12350 stop:13123 length:774 start_codon:yes stop_codon:yes gene_type:complete